MHLPVDALDPPLRDARSDEASSDSARRSKPAVPPPQLAASPTASAEPRVSSPNLAPSPTPVPVSSPASPYYTPVARATGVAGGSQPIPPPQSFSSRSGRTGSGSGSAHSAMRPAPAPVITPRHGYPATPVSGPIASASPFATSPVVARAERPASPASRPPITMPRRASRAPYIAAGIVLVVIIVFLLDSIARNEESAPPPALAAKPAAHTASEPAPSPPIPASAKLEPRAASAVGTPAAEDTVATNHGDEVPSVETTAPTHQLDPSITIRVVSTPPGADVLLAGASIGATPLAVQIKRSTGFATLTVHRARFQDVTTSIDLAANYESDVKLTAIEEPPPAPIVRPAAVVREPRPLPAREPKRPAPAAAPAAASKRCQPVDRFNPFDSSCNGKPCPRCPAP